MNKGHLSARASRALYVGAALAVVNMASILLPISASAASAHAPLRIVAFGDSLTAGFGLPPKQAFPVQLAGALKARGHKVEVINAGVSGDTTAAALARFDWAIPQGTDAVIVELGANDALRGLDPEKAKANLDRIVTALKAKGIEVLLAGMAAPRSLGDDYVAAFDPIYRELAARHGVILYPFFLDGVALRPELNLDDGLHPTGKGISVIVERILPSVEQLIARASARREATAKQ